MAEYADVKRKKILQLLKRLTMIDGFSVNTGGKHQWTVRHTTWQRPFPIPFKQNRIKKYYVEDFAKLIIKTGACDEKTFKEWIM